MKTDFFLKNISFEKNDFQKRFKKKRQKYINFQKIHREAVIEMQATFNEAQNMTIPGPS